MRVQIFSMMAAIGGSENVQWDGDVPIQASFMDDASQVNERIFRFFNRVDENDANTLELIGYRLPSLSMGDLVTWGNKTYRVEGYGFKQITGCERELMELFPR